jgi:hypothetical protein
VKIPETEGKLVSIDTLYVVRGKKVDTLYAEVTGEL